MRNTGLLHERRGGNLVKTDVIARPGNNEAVMTRTFDAPRERVFSTLTDPEMIPRWWGPASLAARVDMMDIRPGGMWRFVQRSSDGSEYAFKGVYHDVSAPERLVYTFEYEGMPGHVLLEIVNLEEHDGKTTMTDTAVFQSVEDRDEAMKGGMEEGAVESMDRFDLLL
jgi:uncharacterized protein YndB with AHSA1/START domain